MITQITSNNSNLNNPSTSNAGINREAGIKEQVLKLAIPYFQDLQLEKHLGPNQSINFNESGLPEVVEKKPIEGNNSNIIPIPFASLDSKLQKAFTRIYNIHDAEVKFYDHKTRVYLEPKEILCYNDEGRPVVVKEIVNESGQPCYKLIPNHQLHLKVEPVFNEIWSV